MFYCEECRKKHEWPKSWSISRGPCEMCRKVADCFDVPSRALPPAKNKDK